MGRIVVHTVVQIVVQITSDIRLRRQPPVAASGSVTTVTERRRR